MSFFQIVCLLFIFALVVTGHFGFAAGALVIYCLQNTNIEFDK